MDFAILYAETLVMFDHSDTIFEHIGFPVACQPQATIRIKAVTHFRRSVENEVKMDTLTLEMEGTHETFCDPKAE